LIKLVDFPCKYRDAAGFSQEIIDKTALSFPESYYDSTSMASLATAVKEEKAFPFCVLPFCHTVEAEALGGKINPGNGRIGPRPQEYAYASIEDLLQVPPIDFSKGRIHQVLLACSLFKERGERVALEICGPYTILSCLMDISLVFKAWRKDPQLVENLFAFINDNLLHYFKAACEAGVDIISYADPAGSLNILGPKYMEKTACLFTLPFLQKATKITAGKALIHLCPQTTFILTGLDMAEFVDIAIPGATSYAAAAMAAIGKADIIGQACLQENSLYLNTGNIKAIRLK